MAKLLFTFLFAVVTVCMQAQNVGIGNTNPTEKLEVTGNVKADTVKPAALKLSTNAGNGKILTSDATGNARWTEGSIVAGNVGYGVWGDCATNGNISEYLPVADSAGGQGDELGRSVSISGEFAFVGIPFADIGANTNQGAVIVYKYENNGWNYFAKLTDATGAADDRFGYSVSINGNYAIVGSYEDDIGANSNQGSASIYQYNGTNWVLMQKITDATGAALDRFGFSVSLSGNRVIVGAPFDDDGANTNEGSASIFQYNGSSWVLMTKLTHVTGAFNDQFGYSVSISDDKAIVGAPLTDNTLLSMNDAGRASIYHYNTTWVLTFEIPISDGADDSEGYSVSIYNNYAVIGRPGRNNDAGDALAYFYNGSTWSLLNILLRPSVVSGDYFGNSVSISGNHILVGVFNDDVGTSNDEGAVALYTKVSNFWQQQQYITDPSGSALNLTGSTVAIDGTTKKFLIGAPGSFSNRGKAIFGKVN